MHMTFPSHVKSEARKAKFQSFIRSPIIVPNKMYFLSSTNGGTWLFLLPNFYPNNTSGNCIFKTFQYVLFIIISVIDRYEGE